MACSHNKNTKKKVIFYYLVLIWLEYDYTLVLNRMLWSEYSLKKKQNTVNRDYTDLDGRK